MKKNERNEIIIKEIENLTDLLLQKGNLQNCTLQNLDLTSADIAWEEVVIDNTTLLGCSLSLDLELELRKKGAFIYPTFKNLPYNPYRKNLYTWQELLDGYSAEKDASIDYQIYQHFYGSRFNPNVNEALSQRIHDHAIDDALRELLGFDDDGMTIRQCVAIMGGHGTSRDDPFYKKVSQMAKLLGEAGYFVLSGGGPGIMEAANLGAYMAGKRQEDLETAWQILAQSLTYKDPHYIEAAQEVLAKFPNGAKNLAIPTWFYGHEPSNLFASHIAKYFSNSIREDTLLAVALYGIVFAPGSAGTTQEIFMDAAQNHYGTFGYYSPMVFLGTKRYTEDTQLYPLLQTLAAERAYRQLLFLSDEPAELLGFIKEHPPILVAPNT